MSKDNAISKFSVFFISHFVVSKGRNVMFLTIRPPTVNSSLNDILYKRKAY
jgi:hypothetical protein